MSRHARAQRRVALLGASSSDPSGGFRVEEWVTLTRDAVTTVEDELAIVAPMVTRHTDSIAYVVEDEDDGGTD